MLFPDENKYDDAFRRASTDCGVPVGVLKGFVALESAFNPKAYRYEKHINDASYGLAQILVGTARGQGFVGAGEELFDPYTSVFYGGKFIRALARKYSRLDDLVASYNMGWPRPITKTTPLIAGIYKYPLQYRESPPTGWKYANEPYTRRTLSYIAYYQAAWRGDKAKAEAIEGLVKARNLEAAYVQTEPVNYDEKKPICPTCKRPLP